VYDDPGPDDGQRVLVGRLWPRGFRKGDPRVDRWISKVTPSTELRAVVGAGQVTLVTAARDLEGSHVAVLARPTAVLGCLLLAT
jgi:uncharacterized protein YeaO (DUF488 family)